MRSITADEINKISDLIPLARLARRQHGSGSVYVEASEELTAIFKQLHAEGATIKSISEASGLRYHSVRARIKK